ncbi:MAG: hypothetical protein L0Y72_09820 [Gemmataceae bacterium]|nr:hypothetical protein [Gemmataceae bacterium]MCI0739329.1 hypothetical protein [Gemmataceae bacterium]
MVLQISEKGPRGQEQLRVLGKHADIGSFFDAAQRGIDLIPGTGGDREERRTKKR